jgi:peroxiredoxin
MKKLLIHFILLYIFVALQGQQKVQIFGTDTSYSDIEIEFLQYTDRITNTEMSLGKTIVTSDGTFSITFDLDRITFVYAYIGVYKVHIYAEPGTQYEIILPPRQDKQPQDFLNPYFSPIVTHLGTTRYSPDELNTLVRMFNDAYLPYYNKHIMALSEKDDFSELDKDIAKMEKPFASSDNQFFNNYRKYRYGILRHLAYQQKSKKISDDYFKEQPVLLNNPSYMELFNQVYNKYFHHFTRTPEGKELGNTISLQNLEELRKVLAKDKILGKDELLDLVILKGIHDEFYDDNYSRSALLEILNAYIEENKYPELTGVAESIRKKTTTLLAGFAPPDFQLYDGDSNLVSLDDFKGKYIYLNFCSCFSYSCLNEFAMLNTLYDKHKELLEIVTVLVDNDYDVINSFLERSNYPWTFLHYGNQASVIKEYDVRAFPTYYLIGPEGKLEISPAPSPGEEFEGRLFKLLREKGTL